MTDIDVRTGVSFAKTPLAEISGKAEEIQALGWQEDGRGDPWAVEYRKSVPRGEDAEAEIRTLMGDYYLTPDDIRELLASK
jgi:hypothetical protein